MMTRTRVQRRLAVGLGALAAAIAAPHGSVAAAGPPCLQPAERAAFQIQSLQSLLMVAALNCRQEDAYNGFVTRFRGDLGGAYRSVAGHFRRTGGGTRKLDEHITNLANAHSQDGIRQGSLFCANVAPVWLHVMALRGGADLASFAVERNVTQTYTADSCPARARSTTAATAAPARGPAGGGQQPARATQAQAGAARVTTVSAAAAAQPR
jgi:hypothetical protein